MASPQRLRLGLIGAGRRAQAHLATMAGLADLYDFVAVCDVDEAQARAVADRFDVSAYTDVRAFLARERLDAVDIVTPPESHHLLVQVAAEHGVHVLVETPLAPTRAMMDCIAEVADRVGVKVEVAENNWRRPQERLNRRALDRGLIGRALRITNFYEIGTAAGWAYHAMNVLRHYAGLDEGVAAVRGVQDRSSVAPMVTDYGSALDGEIWTHALLQFANGVRGVHTQGSAWNSPLRRGHPHVVTVEGTEGLIVSSRSDLDANALHRVENGAEVVYPLEVESRQQGDREVPTRFYYATDPPVEYPNPFADYPLDYGDDWASLCETLARADELASLHRAVTTGSAPAYSIAAARRDQELAIAIQESAHLDGRRVRLPLTAETAWEREQHAAFRARWNADPFVDAERLVDRNFGRGIIAWIPTVC
jgi:predicted dehydrogenase